MCKDPDPAEEHRRYVVQLKNNLAADPGGLEFSISHPGVVSWSATPCARSADELMKPAQPKAVTARDDAAEWLRELLTDGSVDSNQVFEDAKKCGIAERTLRRAKDEIGARAKPTTKDGTRVWQWSLPEESEPKNAS